tara:strand:- start:1805 stop:2491 length:687 start_codon:yes stop_codon:yes gene_type:complete
MWRIGSKKISLKWLKGKESGKDVYILANGPSLKSLDLSFLRGETVIGMNASALIEKKYGVVSKYYVVSDKRFMDVEEKKKIVTSDLCEETIRILRSDIEAVDSDGLEHRSIYVKPLERDGFSKNISNGFFYGCTTTMLALQLAYYIGAKNVYLLGCDLKYPKESPRFYKEEKPQLSDSFVSVQIKNISESRQFFQSRGGDLFGCSQDSFLRSYLPYYSLDEHRVKEDL